MGANEIYDEQEIDLHTKCAELVRREADNIFVIDNAAEKAEEERVSKYAASKIPTRYHGALTIRRNIIADMLPRYVAKARVPLQEAVYDITDPKGLQVFFQDFKKAWEL